MKRFLMVFLLLVMVIVSVAGFAMGEAVDAVPVEEAEALVPEQPSVAAGVVLYSVVSLVMWYVIDWLKELLLELKLKEQIYKFVLLVICLGVGLLLAFTFRVDAFVLVSALMRAVVPDTPVIEPSTVGYIFGGLFFASGSAVVHEISERLNAFKGKK